MTSPNLGNAILAFDDLLHRPDIGAILTEAREVYKQTGHTWLLDQLDAAADQVYTGLERSSGTEKMLHIPAPEHPGWIRLGLLTAFITWCSGKSATCLHDPHPMRPQPVAAAAWKPGLVVCARCQHLLELPKGSVKDRTCDSCGKVTAGVENDDPMWPIRVAKGPFIYLAGACRDCRYWDAS